MASLSASITQGCAYGAGVLTLTSASAAPGAGSSLDYTWSLFDAAGTNYGGGFDPATLPYEISGLPDGAYTSRVQAVNAGNGNTYTTPLTTFTIGCAGGSGGGGGTGGGAALVLDALSHTDETVAAGDGTATIQASGGTPPLTATLVELGLSQTATTGQPNTFIGLPGNGYTLRVTDSSPVPQAVQGTVNIAAYTPPAAGCLDEYADNYNPQATTAGSCDYSIRWRSAWGPAGVTVVVAAVAGQVAGYIAAELRIGFRPGHPLASARPLGAPLSLRATVGPDGYARFVLGPYLRPQLGAPNGAGGYRLDLNSITAYDADLYVGYELRRAGSGELLEHGYALNSAVPDAQIAPDNVPLSPFADMLPVWPGFTTYAVAAKLAFTTRFGGVQQEVASAFDTVSLPCPAHPLPVAWLAPGGGYGFWVFAGRTLLSDVIGDGQTYREALTGEARWSERGEARRSYTASSGPYRGAALAEGLATLARSPQVWVQPVAGGPWVAVTIEAGTFEVRRWGVQRNEMKLTFIESAPHYAQGQ